MKIKQFLMAAAALMLAVSCGPVDEPEPQPEFTPETWSVVGTNNEWNEKTAPAMDYANEYYVAQDVEFAAGGQFKFVKDNNWTVCRTYKGDKPILAGYYYAVEHLDGGANIVVKEAGKYDIYLNKEANTFYLMADGKLPAEAQDGETIVAAPAAVATITYNQEEITESNIPFCVTTANVVAASWAVVPSEEVDETYTAEYVLSAEGGIALEGEELNAENVALNYRNVTAGTEYTIFLAYEDAEGNKVLVTETVTTPGSAAPKVTLWDLADLGLTSFKGTNSSGVYEFDSFNEDESMNFWLKLEPADGVLATAEGVWYDGYRDSEERSVFGFIDDSLAGEWASIVAGSMCLTTTDTEGVYEMLIPEGDPLIFEGYYGNYSVSGVYTINMTVDTKVEFWINPDAGLGGKMLMCESMMSSMGMPGHYFAMETDGGDFAMITLLDMENVDNYVYPTSGFYGLMGEPMPGQKGVLVGYEQFGYFTIGGVQYFPYMPESTTDEMGRSYGVEVWNGAEQGMDVLMMDFYLPVRTVEGAQTVITGCYQGPAGFGGAAAKPEIELNLEMYGFTHFTAVIEGNMAILTSRSNNGSLMLNISNWGEPFASEEGVTYIAGDNLIDGMLTIDDGLDYFECPLKDDGGRMVLYSTETPHVYEVVFSSRAPLTFEGANANYVLPKEIDTYEITIDGLMSAPAGEGDEITQVINMNYPEYPESMIYIYYGDKLIQLDCYNAKGSENAGIVAGTYNVAEFEDYNGTYYIVAGDDMLEGMDYGSYIYAADQTEKFGNITSGSMVAVDNGDGTWTLTFDLTCDTGVTFQGEYTGEILVQ